jgi:hypothetical protein
MNHWIKQTWLNQWAETHQNKQICQKTLPLCCDSLRQANFSIDSIIESRITESMSRNYSKQANLFIESITEPRITESLVLQLIKTSKPICRFHH